MVSENNPDLAIAYYKDPDWIDITDYAKKFRVRNAGVLKVSKLDLTLANRGGLFTSGTNKIPLHSHIRIKGNVRGVWDNIFSGTYEDYGGSFTRAKHYLELVGRGYGQRFLWDTETHNFSEEDITLKAMIENFLLYPDTQYATGITLETDSGLITTVKTEYMEEWDKEGEYLLDWLRDVAETINYDGYIKLVDSNLILNFKAVGTEYASPAVTLSHPFVGSVGVKPELSLDDVYNWILVKGGVESGRPPFSDEWTEDAIAEYDPDIWIPSDGNSSVSDDAEHAPPPYCNNKSVKITITSGGKGAYLDLTKTEDSEIDATSRFIELNFWLKGESSEGKAFMVLLEDDEGNKIGWGGRLNWVFDTWKNWKYPLGPNLPIAPSVLAGMQNGSWFYQTGSSFTWKIRKLHIERWNSTSSYLKVDGLQFRGALQLLPSPPYVIGIPPYKDQASIDAYDIRVHWHTDNTIYSWENAERRAATIRDFRGQPHRKVTCKKGAKIWVKPHQVVTLNVPQYEIDSEEWRPLEVEITWKPLRTTFTLVPKTFKVSSKAYLADELAGLLRD